MRVLDFKIVMIFLGIAMPYLGAFGLYQQINLLLFGMSSAILFGSDISVRQSQLLFFGVTMILASTFVGLLKGHVFNYSDLSDLLFVPILLVIYKSHAVDMNSVRSVFWCSVALIHLNFFIQLPSLFGIDIGQYWAETGLFSIDYFSIRATGLSGQPGKNAILVSLLTLSLHLSMRRYLRLSVPSFLVKVVYLSAYGFAFASVFWTMSRVGIVTFLLVALASPFRFKSFIVFVALALGAGTFFSSLIPAHLTATLLERVSGGDVSSLGYRNIMMQVAFKEVFGNLQSFLTGFGTSKVSADDYPLLIPDHTMRYPDSSFTLALFRYGISGVLFYTGILLHFVRQFEGWLRVLIVLVLSILYLNDPLLHDFKILFAITLLGLIANNRRSVICAGS